jgi:hypothetical protein
MLGSIVSIMVQSWCLESRNESVKYCSAESEDLKLMSAGIILLASVTPAFLNTCITWNINLPHSYQELRKWNELRSEIRNSQEGVELTAGVVDGEQVGAAEELPDA